MEYEVNFDDFFLYIKNYFDQNPSEINYPKKFMDNLRTSISAMSTASGTTGNQATMVCNHAISHELCVAKRHPGQDGLLQQWMPFL